jgi:hypothetical protein
LINGILKSRSDSSSCFLASFSNSREELR